MNSFEATMRRFWEDRATVRQAAAVTGRYTLAERLAWQDVLRRYIDTGRRKARILDVGTGVGYLPLALSGLKHKCVGVDWSRAQLDVAQQRAWEAGANCEFVQSSAESLDFPIEHFDLVIAVNVLDQLGQPQQALKEWLRVLKPGGKLLVAQDDRASADYATYQRAQRAQTNTPLAKSYYAALESAPLFGANVTEIEAAMQLAGVANVSSSNMNGQLDRVGRWLLFPYRVGYTLTVGEKLTSASAETASSATVAISTDNIEINRSS